jgi:hypothetical protein
VAQGVEMDGTCNMHAEMRNAYNIFDGNLKIRNHVGDQDVKGRGKLKWIQKMNVNWISYHKFSASL